MKRSVVIGLSIELYSIHCFESDIKKGVAIAFSETIKSKRPNEYTCVDLLWMHLPSLKSGEICGWKSMYFFYSSFERKYFFPSFAKHAFPKSTIIALFA